MLYVVDKIAKLGGVYLGGQVTNIEIEEAANIFTEQDDKGKIKTTQPNGYEQAKVNIEITLEDTSKENTLEQVKKIQHLFKAPGQGSAKLLKIVNEDCAARGITQVYFKSLVTKKVVSESKRVASLELLAPKIAGIKVKKKTEVPKKALRKTSNAKSKTTKDSKKSPAQDKRSTAAGVKNAKKITK